MKPGDPDPRLSPFTGADDGTCVTFIAHPKRLQKRVRRKRIHAVVGSTTRFDFLRLLVQLDRTRLFKKIYSDTDQVIAIYKRWVDESSQFVNRRIISWENDQEPQLRSLNDRNDIKLQWRVLREW